MHAWNSGHPHSGGVSRRRLAGQRQAAGDERQVGRSVTGRGDDEAGVAVAHDVHGTA